MLRRGKSVVSVQSKKPKLDEKLFVGTLGVNCFEYSQRCLSTFNSNCKQVKFVYIDNGSNAETIKELDEWKNVNPDVHHFEKHYNGRNAGVGVGWNQLIDMALEWGATKIIICNNDIAFGPHTVDGLCEAYDRLRKEVPETVMVTATNHTKNPNNLKEVKQEWSYAEHPDFSCYMITPETLDRVGKFSEDYDQAFFEDNDMHWRILLMGYKAFGCNWAPYSHIASRTRYGNPNLVTHANFRECKIAFHRNMVTDTVSQEVADSRHQAWLQANPTVKHPKHTEVIEFCRKQGIIGDDLVRWIDQLDIMNVPV